ncbi:helix-turn-helix domain-containing protein [Marinactinospora thermotolerans]|uniref:helix-turn-helix domain-containing protein n=1 Tax=Marinactinospora thermotolerans TaxID=531310 RepID=UPI003D934082
MDGDGWNTAGDLGRRVAHRRAQLGISLEELAVRADMDPGYVAYLEESPANPSSQAVERLARALDTTPEDLRGAYSEAPPGAASTAAADPVLCELDRSQCMELIAQGGVGRVAFCVPGERSPMVLPVNFAVVGGAVVFRTRSDGLISRHLGEEVTFEVDRLDTVSSTGWSVVVRGPARRLTDPGRVERVRSQVQLRSWAGGRREAYVEITAERVTGRRVEDRAAR